MDVKEVVNAVTDRIKDTANVRVVFGDPIQADGLTLIPVASVKVSGGGGGGTGKDDSESAKKGTGMGLGLNVVASPVGYIEVRDGEARMVDIVDKNKLAVGGLIAGGLVVLTFAKLLAWQVKHRGR